MVSIDLVNIVDVYKKKKLTHTHTQIEIAGGNKDYKFYHHQLCLFITLINNKFSCSERDALRNRQPLYIYFYLSMKSIYSFFIFVKNNNIQFTIFILYFYIFLILQFFTFKIFYFLSAFHLKIKLFKAHIHKEKLFCYTLEFQLSS